MQTIKNVAARHCMVLAAAVTLFAGCGAPGPRALLQGQKLLEQGKYAAAVAKLKTATALLSTNAQAWNYLGLACQQSGEVTEADDAYHRALQLDPDLTEAHYNLGCLWLGQNKPEAAKTEFTAYTLRRGNAPEGFVKLGTAELRCRELAAAERSFSDALRLDKDQPEAWTGLGLVQFQRGRPAEAARYFQSALQQQPNYPPALLNMAILMQEHLQNRPAALKLYRDYLAQKPVPDNAAAVSNVVRQLEQEMGRPPRPAATNTVSQNGAPVSNFRTSSTEAGRNSGKSAGAGAGTALSPVPRAQSTESGDKAVPAPSRTATPSKPPSAAAPLRPAAAAAPATQPSTEEVHLPDEPVLKFPRYAYKTPVRPGMGNHPEAVRAFAQGLQAQQAQRLPEAMQAYRRATQLDPAYFDAYYNLGLAASETGNPILALASYETALAIQPGSSDARYNFALALKQANYPVDAANELEKVLLTYPNESRTHLALGNLYAQQLRQPGKARQHYVKLLETDPNNAQATAIRYWLADHPR